jgi:flagellar biosynthesis chaperone FliJ
MLIIRQYQVSTLSSPINKNHAVMSAAQMHPDSFMTQLKQALYQIIDLYAQLVHRSNNLKQRNPIHHQAIHLIIITKYIFFKGCPSTATHHQQ